MSDRSKLSASHLRRCAFVYVRQSTQAQLDRNVESTERQYALVARAVELGFARERVVVIDEDLGVSGSGVVERSGFARLAAEVTGSGTPGWCSGWRCRGWRATRG
jgi:DNA invertase Pin-like site-specific DNA recombinase